MPCSREEGREGGREGMREMCAFGIILVIAEEEEEEKGGKGRRKGGRKGKEILQYRTFASGMVATAQPAASASWITASKASAIRTLTPMTITGLAAFFHWVNVLCTAARRLAVLESFLGGIWKGMGREIGSSAMLQAISM